MKKSQPTKQRIGILRVSAFCLAAAWSLLACAQTPPVIPDIDGAMRTHLLAVMNSSAGLTRYRDSFIKVGDSITESGSFLTDLGCENFNTPDSGTIASFGSFSDLIPTADYFSHSYSASTPGGFSAWCGIRNPYTRSSIAAMSGMTSSFAMAPTTECSAPNNTTLRCEISQMNPTYAVIMFGTNDAISTGMNSDLTTVLTNYRNNMTQIVDTCLELGVIPILSTIPPLFSIPDPDGSGPGRDNGVLTTSVNRVANFNQELINLASSRQIPLWNFNRSLIELGLADHYGINMGDANNPDGIHPAAYQGSNAAIFTSTPVNTLVYGYNVRNLNTLQVLQKLQTTLTSEIIFHSSFE